MQKIELVVHVLRSLDEIRGPILSRNVPKDRQAKRDLAMARRQAVNERVLRQVVRSVVWAEQRTVWADHVKAKQLQPAPSACCQSSHTSDMQADEVLRRLPVVARIDGVPREAIEQRS